MSNMDSRKEEARKREAKRITRENIALMRQDTLSIASLTTSCIQNRKRHNPMALLSL